MAEKRRLELVLAGVDRISAPIRKITTRMERMNRPVQRLRRSFRDLGRSAGFSQLSQSIGRVTAAVRNLAFAAGALAAGSAYALNRFIGAGDKIAKTAAAIGISSEALQEWRYAADRMGVSNEVLDKGFIKFGRTLGELKLGTGTLYTILKKNTPALLKQFQAVKTTDEGMELFVETLSGLEDQGLKSALAAAALGRSGPMMAKLLGAGAKEVKKLRDEARDLGLVMSDETAASAEEAQDQLTKVSAVVKGIAYSIGAAMLPRIKQLLDELLAWRERNKELIKVKVVATVNALAEGIKLTYKFLKITIPFVLNIVEALGGFKVVAAAVAGLIVGKLIIALVALSATLLTTPIGWILLGISGIAAGAALIIKNWEPLKKWWSDFWQSISDSMPAFFSWGGGGLAQLLAKPGPELATAGAGGASSVSGQVGIDIKSDQPASVTYMKASPGLDLDVMAGPSGTGWNG